MPLALIIVKVGSFAQILDVTDVLISAIGSTMSAWMSGHELQAAIDYGCPTNLMAVNLIAL